MNDIEYKILEGNPDYKFYKDGKVFSNKRNRFLCPHFSQQKNHWIICLKSGDKCLHITLFKLFKGEIKKGHHIMFKDGDKNNLHVDNLIQICKKDNKIKEFDENVWKKIPGYEYRYLANKEGEIMSLYEGKILEDNYNTKYEQSYKIVELKNEQGRFNKKLIHILVWITFMSPIPKGMKIDHINRNKFDNRLANLRCVTGRDNAKNRNFPKNIKRDTSPILDYNFINIGTCYKEYDFSDYEINEHGQIRNLRKMLLKQRENKLYKVINIKDKITKKKINVRINKITATIFIPNPNNYPQVNHKDKCRWNNHISNLEWIDPQKHAIHTHGKKVSQYTLEGIFIKTFESVMEASKSLGKNDKGDIGKVCNEKRKTAYGFIWKWAE